MTENCTSDLQKAIDFHGHSCPGLTIGYLAAKVAMEKLGVGRAEDEELVAIVETDACGIDAIQALLGCTIGKGNLIFKDYGKQVYTIACRTKNKAVRIAMKTNIFAPVPAQDKLRDTILKGEASPKETCEFKDLQQSRIEILLATDLDTLFKIEFVDMPLPQSAKIFNSVICEYCGEKMMEPRARLKDGKISCLSCFDEYSRGW